MDTDWEIKSLNIMRAYKDAHVGETAASGTDANPVDIVKDLMKQGVPLLTREIATFYDVPKGGNNVVVPIVGTVAAGTATAGDYGAVGQAVITFKTITVASDYGVNFQWNRDFAEKAQWDAMSPFLAEGLRAVEDKLMTDMLGTIVAAKPAEGTFALSATLTWGDFTKGIQQLAEYNYKCDKVICAPALYKELLDLQQFVDASYVGTDSNITSGVLRTQLGADIICTTKCPSTVMLFIDSDKAIGVGHRRDGKVEEYSYPDVNKYGVVVSSVYGVQALSTMAIGYGLRP